MPMNAWTTAGALFSLGALHGLNPGMGWLFAVALGMQHGDRRAVWGALGPLALGHALAIGAAVAIALGVGVVVPSSVVRWGAAVLLIGLGVLQLRGHRHALGRWRVGLRASARELTVWSFIVATAHGAGLMAAPFALRAAQPDAAGRSAHGAHSMYVRASVASIDWPTLWSTAVHTLGYLIVTAALASVVYERASIHVVRRAWINFDLVWAAALLLTGVAIALM
jgi:hypothetical protein